MAKTSFIPAQEWGYRTEAYARLSFPVKQGDARSGYRIDEAVVAEYVKHAALLILETGVRVDEVVALEKTDVRLDPSNGKKFGYLRIKNGKSKNARRVVSLTSRRSLLKLRMSESDSNWVFPGDGENAFLATSLNHQHGKIREKLGLPKDFVLHSFRHSMLTWLGEAGVNAFTIMRVAGHSSVRVSQRYVHPSAEYLEIAFERLERFNSQLSRRKRKRIERDRLHYPLHLQEPVSSDTEELSVIQ